MDYCILFIHFSVDRTFGVVFAFWLLGIIPMCMYGSSCGHIYSSLWVYTCVVIAGLDDNFMLYIFELLPFSRAIALFTFLLTEHLISNFSTSSPNLLLSVTEMGVK